MSEYIDKSGLYDRVFDRFEGEDLIAKSEVLQMIANAPAAEKIIFICDRRDKCVSCSYPTCQHTADISHAANFVKDGNYFVEQLKTSETKEGVK